MSSDFRLTRWDRLFGEEAVWASLGTDSAILSVILVHVACDAEECLWFEFGVRFVGGAMLGAPVSMRLVLYWWLSEDHATLGLISLTIARGCGLAAALLGDKFWHAILGR